MYLDGCCLYQNYQFHLYGRSTDMSAREYLNKMTNFNIKPMRKVTMIRVILFIFKLTSLKLPSNQFTQKNLGLAVKRAENVTILNFKYNKDHNKVVNLFFVSRLNWNKSDHLV